MLIILSGIGAAFGAVGLFIFLKVMDEIADRYNNRNQ